MVFRTDLAVEARELFTKDIGGMDYFTRRYGDVTLTRLKIKTPEAAGKIGKPIGTYLTFDVPPFSDDFRDPAARIELIGKELAALLPERGTDPGGGPGQYGDYAGQSRTENGERGLGHPSYHRGTGPEHRPVRLKAGGGSGAGRAGTNRH